MSRDGGGGGPEENKISWGGLDECCTEVYLKLNVEGKGGGSSKIKFCGVGEKHPAHSLILNRTSLIPDDCVEFQSVQGFIPQKTSTLTPIRFDATSYSIEECIEFCLRDDSLPETEADMLVNCGKVSLLLLID